METLSDITVDTDPALLDKEFIHDFLTNVYWSKGRTMDEVEEMIRHSINFGIYKNGKQIGYARVLSDHIFLAYLLDVFITEAERGKGYGKLLMDHVMESPILKKVKIWRLGTDDAQGLYLKYGFEPIPEPEKCMVKRIG